MKKYLLIVITCFFWLGCSPEDSEPEKDVTNGIIPMAPTNLMVKSELSSEAELQWTDNSTNENGFKIERKSSGQNYTVVGDVSADIMNYRDSDLKNGEEYFYRVYAYNSTGKSLTYTNEVSVTPKGIPLVETSSVSSITGISAVSSGKITDDSGASITQYGVIWNTEPNPKVNLSTKTINYDSAEQFEDQLTNLHSETKYYLRAYAVNDVGVGYGEEISFTTDQLPLKSYKITFEGLLDGDHSNYPDPTTNSFFAEYLFDNQSEILQYSESITNEIWIEKSKTLSARNQVGVKVYIEQDYTFLTYLVFEVQDMDTGEIVFRGDVGPSTIVSPSSPENWGDNAAYEIKVIYNIAKKEMDFSY